VFEVRGMRNRIARGRALAPRQGPGEVRFGYVGEDELFRETIVEVAPDPHRAILSNDRVELRWTVALEPHGSFRIELAIESSPHGSRRSRRSFDEAADRAKASAERWRRRCTDVQSRHPTFNQFLAASVRDLHLLDTPVDGGRILAAGIPWFVAPFGRDALLASYEMLALTSEPARNTLRYLARFQAKDDDPLRDAEPGKILHEKRAGELARAGEIPHTPYYGSVDSTPLFLMLAAAYHRWTGDLALMGELRPRLDSALAWIDRYGDLDGDGFVEYRRRSPAGLDNQGWKDSDDAVIHVDGTKAEPPIALAEVQGYVYLAKQRIAEVYEALGASETAEALRTEAQRLRAAFNEAFWMPDEGFFAMALDGQKRQVRSVTSNPGHGLYCGVIDPVKAAAVAERLMANDMFSGWGIRTLSAEHRAYNPMSYHDGSVWPHDNAIIAAGLKRYGFSAATERIATAMFDVALGQRDLRLPELFCGFDRRAGVPMVAYPVACRPQAWAAAAPFMLLQSMLGISARAPEGVLAVHEPALPQWLDRVELRDLAVGSSKVSLAFTRDGTATSFSLLHREGDIRIAIQE
jgi:glycogen debranching enzyme